MEDANKAASEERRRRADGELERRIQERTIELTNAIELLKREIAERERAEDALRETERVRVMAQTAVAAAHEIFQPLTAVLGQAEILLTKMAPSDPLRKDVEAIREAGKKIVGIVNRMKNAQRYVTKSYVTGVDMIDFDEASRSDPP